MKVRFVTCNDTISELIRDREGLMARTIGWTPSHVEMAGFNMPDGSPGYLGAHYDGGLQIRPVGYDKASLQHELFVDVPLPRQVAAEALATQLIGAPYDWEAIVQFLVPVALHQPRHFICSAVTTIVLTRGGAFAGPLAKEPHTVSPADLMFLLSGRQSIVAPTPEKVAA